MQTKTWREREKWDRKKKQIPRAAAGRRWDQSGHGKRPERQSHRSEPQTTTTKDRIDHQSNIIFFLNGDKKNRKRRISDEMRDETKEERPPRSAWPIDQ